MTLEHIRPESLHDLLKAMDTADYTLFAGGTDLMIRKRQWQGASRRFEEPIAFINQLKELRGIEDLGDHYRIGALTTQEEMATSGILPDYLRNPTTRWPPWPSATSPRWEAISSTPPRGGLSSLLMALDAEWSSNRRQTHLPVTGS